MRVVLQCFASQMSKFKREEMLKNNQYNVLIWLCLVWLIIEVQVGNVANRA